MCWRESFLFLFSYVLTRYLRYMMSSVYSSLHVRFWGVNVMKCSFTCFLFCFVLSDIFIIYCLFILRVAEYLECTYCVVFRGEGKPEITKETQTVWHELRIEPWSCDHVLLTQSKENKNKTHGISMSGMSQPAWLKCSRLRFRLDVPNTSTCLLTCSRGNCWSVHATRKACGWETLTQVSHQDTVIRTHV